MKTILICTDAWEPQVNGVVRALKTTNQYLENDYKIEIIHPGLFRYIPCPFYNEIHLAYSIKKQLIKEYVNRADTIHIATEGPIGFKVRNYCKKNKIPFTTAYHTNFPATVWNIAKIPPKATYKYLKWFHAPSDKILVTTETNKKDLQDHGIKNEIAIWPKGVDTDLFIPKYHRRNDPPRALYVGRISKEKGIENFLKVKTPLKKIIVGDGPLRKKLEKKYPNAQFLGYKYGNDLIQEYQNADIFVLPSINETFGLVILEALACGLPVAGYSAPGLIDTITQPYYGYLSEDLEFAIKCTLNLGNPQHCREKALQYNWAACTKAFIDNLTWKDS